MKKNLVALLASAVMTASLLAGCGEAAEVTTEEATEVVTEVSDEVVEEVAGCSDEVFAALQEDYATLVAIRDEAVEIYMDDSVEQNDDIEAAFTECDEIIAEMGEISQDEITDADALELENAINDLISVFETLVGAMDVAEVVDGICSDETFAAITEEYAILTEIYETVADEYLNNDDVAQNDAIEEALSLAEEVIAEVGEISQEELTEAAAVELDDQMGVLAETLTTLYNAF